MARSTPDWSTVADLIAKLERRWNRGTWLKAYAHDEPFEPIKLSATTPSASDIIERTAEVRAWATRFRSDASSRSGVTVIDKTVRSRAVGENSIPSGIGIEKFTDLTAALKKGADTAALDTVVASTDSSVPEASEWVRNHPQLAIEYAHDWTRIVAAVRWVVDNDVSGLDLRHIDATGVDSKFLVEHQRIIRPLLDEILPDERVIRHHTALDQRYGFRSRPTHVRLRTLGNDLGIIAAAFSEVELRVDELARQPLPVSTVYVVENRATFNAFPNISDSIVVFGSGYAVTALGPIGWLHNKQLVYWGDIDTHGFRILDRLRTLFPNCASILMDSETLQGHVDRLVEESSPISDDLRNLTPAEMRTYRELRENRHGPAVRLEQERISMTTLRRRLEHRSTHRTQPSERADDWARSTSSIESENPTF